jgi:polyisoprenoid-binding protein YceI
MKTELRYWVGGAAALALTTAALSSWATFAGHQTDQDVISFKTRAGAGGVLDIKIEGSASGVVASEKNGKLVIKAPVASFDTGNGGRDKHLRSTLESKEHPYVTLSVARSQLPSLTDGQAKEGSVNGALSIAGKTRTIPVRYRAKRAGQDYEVQAMFFVDIQDFGIEPPCKGPICVEPKVTIAVKSFVLRDKS